MLRHNNNTHKKNKTGHAPLWFSFGAYLKARFGGPVRKIPIDADFSCPNRDGTLGTTGCTYCQHQAFSPHAQSQARGATPLPIREQCEAGIARARRKGMERFMAYFQSYSNTYGPVALLKDRYDQALCDDGIVALAIGTRPDCITPGVLDLLSSYAGRYEVWLELGLQTIHDETLSRINRGHDHADFLSAVDLCRGRPIKLCFHVIIGLPGETREHNRQTARSVAGLNGHGIKLHALQVVKETLMAEAYRNGQVTLINRDEYAIRAADFLEQLPPDVVIQRLTSDALGDTLIAPDWTAHKQATITAIQRELEKRGTRQGSHSQCR